MPESDFDPYVWDLDGWDKLWNQLGDMENGRGEIGWMITDAMVQSLSVLKQEIVARTPVNFGHLRGSIYTEINGTPANMEGSVANLHGTTLPAVLYGWPVERGRAPGKWPPRDAIELWVVRKGLARAGTREASSIAFLIARAIGQRGTKGAAMFYKGLEAATPAIDRIWANLLDSIVEQLAVGS